MCVGGNCVCMVGTFGLLLVQSFVDRFVNDITAFACIVVVGCLFPIALVVEFIPFGNGEKFVMETSGMSGTGALFEAYADSYIYLQEINQQELDNYLLEVKKNNRPVRKEYHKDENGVTLRDTEGKEIFDVIPCLKIGDKRIPNKNIGNWE